MVGPVSRDPVLALVLKGLDAATLRQRVTAHNLANINTPGFKKSQVRFEEKLADLLNREDTGGATGAGFRRLNLSQVENINPEVVQPGNGPLRQDGNNVQLDVEIGEMLMNNLLYATLMRQAGDRLENLRYVINEGRR